MKNYTSFILLIAAMVLMPLKAICASEYTVKVGEIVKLEISSSTRSTLSRSTGKVGKWDVNQLELEVVSYSWDYAYVKGLKETSLSVVQLTVTHNHDGIYGDKYYVPFHVKVVGNGIGDGTGGNTGGGATSPTLQSISIPSELNLETGKYYQLTPTLVPSNAKPTLSWLSTDETVATVYDGFVSAKKAGSTVIRVMSDNGKYAFCSIYVSDPKPVPSSVSIVPSSISVKTGETYQLNASVYPYNAVYTMSWKSSKTSVATVTSNGKVTAQGVGTCTITASTDNGKSATCNVTVTKPVVYPTSVSIQSSLSMEVGDIHTLSAEVLPTNAEYSLAWSSSDKNVAIVDNGKITAVGAGTCEVSVSTNNGKTASCHVTVNNPVVLAESVSIQTSLAMEVGDSYTLSAEVLPANAEYSLTWTSSDKNVATVDNGKVTAKGAGTCEITVTTDNDKSATCVVTVNAEVGEPKDPITANWDGTYCFTSTVTKYEDSEIDFKENFELTICNKDDTFFITSMLGCNTAYLIHEGLKLNIIDDANAELVLDYNDDLGGPAEGGYYSCMHIISPESEYKYNYHQVIRLARLDNKKIKMDDFYIYAFGLETDFDYSKEVRYSNCNGEKTSGTTAIVEVNSRNSGQVSIYDMNGKCVYIGLKTETPILKTGTYVIKEGNTTKKIYIK